MSDHMERKTYMSDFEETWHFCANRRNRNMVQKKDELERVYSLMQDCRSYLEVGTAEGDSLYILSHALQGSNPYITYVDLAESHTQPYRVEVLKIMRDEKMNVRGIHGSSQNHDSIEDARIAGPFDAILIDGDHTFAGVISDAIAYGGMARKYIFFHDIVLPEVRKAFEWYVSSQGYKDVERFADYNSRFGFGIIKL